MSNSSNKRAPTTATQRLKQDYLRIKKDPVPYICAEPLPSNILEWHYVVRGPELTPYEGGYYHGKLIFPREFPFKPPSIYMITPNGRFKCNTREMKQQQQAQQELSSRPPSLPLPDVVPDGDAHVGHNVLGLPHGHHVGLPHGAPGPPGLQQPHRNHGLLGGALANLFVIVGFAAFAYTVKYVLRSIAQE
ncbi:ubiquitin-conjugating enzyme E2 J2 [Malurus melanocephalus]|uniref:ubiquitin-conjugating enzyme E2 J2 n=1 Tax=Malurus melanocephalus TaxID=175006 RepID=UPI0025488C2C|nr:ubiquitin-conjugating enzyme E2 J2 [Malurus melanocephalus]